LIDLSRPKSLIEFILDSSVVLYKDRDELLHPWRKTPWPLLARMPRLTAEKKSPACVHGA
ncbi:MAG TPA: hypothetical protein PK972_15015, partial [Deltaproteobacteria bacterium]|nr:hypothetical protein [Deltaproteobacteria bacterium]HPL88110.1 hypothetical protein [Deltaproteobacteria bacterium]